MTETSEAFFERSSAASGNGPLSRDSVGVFPSSMREATTDAVRAYCGEQDFALIKAVDAKNVSWSASDEVRTNAAGDTFRTIVNGKVGSMGRVADYTYKAEDGSEISVEGISRNDDGAVWQFSVGDKTWTRADRGKGAEQDPDGPAHRWNLRNKSTGEESAEPIDLGHITIDEHGFRAYHADPAYDGLSAVEHVGLDVMFKSRGIAFEERHH